MPQHSLTDKRRLVTALALLLGIGFAAAALLSYYLARQSMETSIVESGLPLTADNIYSEIQKDLIRPVLISSMMATDTFLRDWILNGEQDVADATRDIRHGLMASLVLSALITAIVLLFANLTINRYQRRLELMATTDTLTGLLNRQAFELLVPQALRESERNRTPLLALMLDVDHFKSVNDQFGHLAGDRVLAATGRVIRDALRKSDIVCRWGGEEFLVVVKGTSAAEGEHLAEKIRLAIESHAMSHDGKPVSITVSLGVAAARPGDTADSLVARADEALYRAKKSGRNAVSIAPEA